jgi:hypothetical protein
MHFSALRGRRTVPHILARLRLPLLAVVASLVSQGLHAAVISRDWKTPGDGLLTYDDVNQREWLDLPTTLLSQFPGVGREGKFQYVVAETGIGGLFAGFAVATRVDVSALAVSAGIDVTTLDDFNGNSGPATALAQLLGFTHPSSPDALHSVGLLNEIDPPPFAGRVGAHVLVDADSGPNGQAGVIFGADDDLLSSPLPGVWLYRAVPEMTGQSLAIIGLSALLFSPRLFGRRLRQKKEGALRPPRGGCLPGIAVASPGRSRQELFEADGHVQPVAGADVADGERDVAA